MKIIFYPLAFKKRLEKMTEQKYKQLSNEERFYIDIQRKSGVSMTQIGLAINRDKSSISRELKRNAGDLGYDFQQAQTQTTLRHTTKTKAIKLIDEMRAIIVSYLEQKWSPEQIFGRMKLEGLECVSPQTIYQLIESDKTAGGTLYLHLRHESASYERGKNKGDYRGKMPDRVDISERPKVVDDKSRVGDWEADTVIGKGHQGVLVTLTERVTKLNFAVCVASKEAGVVKDAILKALSPLKELVHTITFDNGTEFWKHSEVASQLGCKTFFAKPYCSWQRGLNENHNGLLRQFFPKKMPLDTVTQNELDAAIDAMNHRPRKKLGYKTPWEVFTSLTGFKPTDLAAVALVT
jgi:IS30 family transposase